MRHSGNPPGSPMRHALLLLLMACSSGKPGGDDAAADASVPEDSGTAPAVTEAPLAAGVRIERAVLAQNSGVLLAEDGAAVTARTAPVVAGREGRLLVQLSAEDARTVEVMAEVLEADNTLWTAASATVDLAAATTAELVLPAEALDLDNALSISILEVDNTERSGDLDGARVPAEGWLELDARAVPPLEVVLVSLEVDGEGPPLDEATLAATEAALLAWYPTAEVRLSVHELPLERAPRLSSLEDLAEAVFTLGQRRLDDGADPAVVYYGVYDSSYTGGLAGASDFSEELRAAAGPSLDDPANRKVMAHELGHLMGAFHAPACRAGSIDPDYPAEDGTVGIETWDPLSERWLPPETTDLMGFCAEVAVSPYTSAQLARGLGWWEEGR